MNIPWSGFTKKRDYSPEKDRLQYKDLAEKTGRLMGQGSSTGAFNWLSPVKQGNCQEIAAFLGFR